MQRGSRDAEEPVQPPREVTQTPERVTQAHAGLTQGLRSGSKGQVQKLEIGVSKPAKLKLDFLIGRSAQRRGDVVFS